jgi:hypothetical protein
MTVSPAPWHPFLVYAQLEVAILALQENRVKEVGRWR